MLRVHSAMLKQQCHMPRQELRCTSKGHKHLHLGVNGSCQEAECPLSSRLAVCPGHVSAACLLRTILQFILSYVKRISCCRP